MPQTLTGRKIAILVTDGFEQVEMTDPRNALDQEGAQTALIAPSSGTVRGWKHRQWGDEFPVDVPLEQADPNTYDALLLPGGVMSPDRLRMNPRAVAFVRSFVEARKPIASICHGPWLLVEANAVRDRTLTSWPSLQTDIRNAGGRWVDQEVLVDQGLVTSRKPDDLPAFNAKMLEEFREGKHQARRAA
jgi:protease I